MHRRLPVGKAQGVVAPVTDGGTVARSTANRGAGWPWWASRAHPTRRRFRGLGAGKGGARSWKVAL